MLKRSKGSEMAAKNKSGYAGAGAEVVETIDGQWMILVRGVQWGKGPRDLSGAAGDTWATKREAIQAWRDEVATWRRA